ncbi:helix-turn-helix domain-containing protein [Sphaerochaeta sp. PS]|uniref:AraC family transcriptional regulator n=1 Tax=Sphaerochaeta sp. PS TaxID=3076336 RepID=UPI0028A40FB5|nr:helix-turn-helix domain-containing protein [Sphaerochaeta sp. PS]MDT4761977.1 AraC family transcriptional regulator [Sphaerochaeta sp. PS]
MEMIDAVFVYQMHEKQELLWHQRIHSHEAGAFEIHYFVGGSGTFTNAKNSYTIYPGSLFVTSDEKEHSITSDEGANLTYYATLLHCPEEQELFKKLEGRNPLHIGTNLRFFFEEVRDKALSQKGELRLSACHQLLGFLYNLLAGSVTERTVGEHVRLEKAIRHMQRHVFDKLSLSQIASHVGLDPSYFVRLFRKRMNTTPMKYYTSLQLEAARALLTSSDLSVKEIAAKLQFCSEFHFSKQFKQSTGSSPSLYRKTHLQLLGI